MVENKEQTADDIIKNDIINLIISNQVTDDLIGIVSKANYFSEAIKNNTWDLEFLRKLGINKLASMYHFIRIKKKRKRVEMVLMTEL